MLSFNSFKIQDSLSHLPSSLAKLVENLRLSGHDWKIMRQSKLLEGKDGNVDQDKLKVALRKGLFPYEYAKSVSILKKTHGIPPRNCFASKITEQTKISESDHAWAVYVYDLFSCESLYDYLQVYNHIGM